MDRIETREIHSNSAKSKSELIDPNTVATTVYQYHDNKLLHLVMSDEFEDNGRRFDQKKGIFNAVMKPDNSNDAIQFCKLLWLIALIWSR